MNTLAALSALAIRAAARCGSCPRMAGLCQLIQRWAVLGRGGCALLMVILSLLSGCASLPAPDAVHRPSSQALAGLETTALGRIATASLDDGPAASSGLRLLPDGDQAFDALVALIRAAEKSIDAQYYVVADDSAGREFLRELRDAAARGVRVRLLVDDLYVGGEPGLLSGLAAHRNIELRVFNPLPARSGTLHSRVFFSLHDFGRVNRRMHNKLFVADNSFAVTGGRNIADAYFGRGEPAHFIDMDVLAAGPVVRELSAFFDRYWNCVLSYPLDSVAARAPDLEAERRGFAARTIDAVHAPLPHGLRDPLGRTSVGMLLAEGRIELQPAGVRVVAENVGHPDEPQAREASPDAPAGGAVMGANLELLGQARSELLVVSPYFVPTPAMVDAFQQARLGGARITLMTNSLATTDEPLVHFGYARYRAAIVNMGVSLHELMPASETRATGGEARQGSLGRLHAKLAVADRRWLYVGSMNMDRRSAHCNTELGLVIDSPALADELTGLIRRERMPKSFSVRQAAGGQGLEWVHARDGHEQVFDREPHSSWAQRTGWTLLSLMVDEDFL